MIEFKEIDISDKTWMDKFFEAENSRSSEFCFTNVFTWGSFFGLKAAVVEEMLVFDTVFGGKRYYTFPIGKGNLRAAILAIAKDAEAKKRPFTLRSITPENTEKIDILFPCHFRFKKNRDYFDYVYSAEKLATLSGKQLHAKRNYINRFEQRYKWSFEPVDESNLNICMDMNAEWVRRHVRPDNYNDYRHEIEALDKVFKNYSALGLDGGILKANEQPVAFTMGEKLCSDTYIVHFEKAMADVEGAFQMVNREFVRFILSKHPEIIYINREDDMGSENLRKAKKSYYPEFLVEKYNAIPV